jgi:hypothetical protein
MECPSKISSSCPPTVLHSATRNTALSCPRGEDALALLCSPDVNGEAERLTTSSAPAAASSVVGGPGTHMSSQIVIPTFVPATSMSASSSLEAK